MKELSKIRLLQKVARDKTINGTEMTYRYDLLADAEDENVHYIIRAHKSELREGGEVQGEYASIVKPIFDRGPRVRELFLDIAHAEQPVDPVHLEDVVQDHCTDHDIEINNIISDTSLRSYYDFDNAWRHR